MTSQRIQRQRTKGWRMPEGAVYVGRPSKWGNPYDIKSASEVAADDGLNPSAEDLREFVVFSYRRALDLGWLPITSADVVRELEGRDLACWCSLDQPCHADVLLEVANAGGAA